jgi:hypothetical protein
LFTLFAGADPGFQARGAHLKELRRAKGGAKSFGVFRVKNHDFTPKNLIQSGNKLFFFVDFKQSYLMFYLKIWQGIR